jgi:4-hydroxybenzoate polyprenyltransferase
MNAKLIGFLRLTRPANVVTAISDVLAGIALSGFFLLDTITFNPVVLLIISTMGLYAGGIVFNDVFDADLDTVERPERPIPSGLIKKIEAQIFGTLLLFMGILSAAFVNQISAFIALAITLAALLYDKWGKHQTIIGPINMGICRGLNLLLGMSILSSFINLPIYIIIVPILYIAAITIISRGEVHGSSIQPLVLGACLYAIVILSILYVGWTQHHFLTTLSFVLAFSLMILPPLVKAIQRPSGKLIGKSVKAGVIGLILMNAAWVACMGNILMALLVAALLPISIGLAKLFAVT